MILADTSIWIDHFRHGNTRLAERLMTDDVVIHPFVIGELACGSLRRRVEVLDWLGRLPSVTVASHGEAMSMVDARKLHGQGIGWVDAHLLASAMISGTGFWTLDRRLAAVVRGLNIH